MPRHVVRRWDTDRTDVLNQNELFVVDGRGDSSYYYAWLQEPEVEACPLCGSKAVKVQDLFSKTYRELVTLRNKPVCLKLEFGFYKYRCQNDECRHIFAKDIRFASRNDNVTFRLESKIVQMVLAGCSYGNISDFLQEALTRQAVGQIFNRWVHDKDDKRVLRRSLSTIALISGLTDKDAYTLVFNLDDGIRIYDVFYGVQSSDLAGLFQKMGVHNVKTVISDCNPTIIDAIKDSLPNALHIIPAEYWFRLVEDDFREYAHEIVKWSTIPKKEEILLMSPAELGQCTYDLERLFVSRPKIMQPYMDFSKLREMVTGHDVMWVYAELLDWTQNIDPVFQERLSETIDQLRLYKDQIEAHVQHIQNSIMIVRPKRNEDIRYLRYSIESLVRRGYVEFVCNKATFPHFTKDKLEAAPVVLFSTEEQREIADHLDRYCSRINELISEKELLVSDLEAYKKSLIFEVVTGKRRVC